MIPGASRGWTATAAALAAVLAAVAIFLAPAFGSGRDFFFRDNLRMHLPAERYVAAELARGHVPQWNPYGGLGTPLLADPVLSLQHPLTFLLPLVPVDLFFKVWVLLSYAVAASGAFAWARTLGRSRGAAALAGIAFALSGHLVSSSDNLTFIGALSVLPWMFVTAHRFAARPGPGRLAAVAAASYLCVASGDPQSWGFAVLALPGYAALAVRAGGLSRRRMLLRGLAAATAAALAAGPVVTPVLAWLPHSSRGDALPSIADQMNLPPARVPELVVPRLFWADPLQLDSPEYVGFEGSRWGSMPWVLSIYAGASVVALALVGAAASRRARALAVGAVPFLWMALGPFAGFSQLARHVPVLGRFRFWEKMVVWPTLFLAVAAAFGADALAARARVARRAPRWLGAAAGLAGAATAAAAIWPSALVEALQRRGGAEAARALVANLRAGAPATAAFAVAIALLAAASARRRRIARAAPAIAAVVAALDLAAANAGASVLVPPPPDLRPPLLARVSAEPGLQRVIPETIVPVREGETTWDAGVRWWTHTGTDGWSLAYRVGNLDAYTAMIPARMSRLRLRTGADVLPVMGLWSFAWSISSLPAGGVSRVHLPPPYRLEAIDGEAGAMLVAIPHRPRAYLAGALRSVDRRGAMDAVLAAKDPRVVEGRDTVVEAPVPAGYAPPSGTADVVRDDPERVDVATTSDRPALLVLNDQYAYGWTATVDGRPAAILPANYVARGVWVGPGRHVVAFSYRTPGLVAGWAIAGALAAALAAWAALRRRGRTATAAGAGGERAAA